MPVRDHVDGHPIPETHYRWIPDDPPTHPLVERLRLAADGEELT